MIFLAVKIFLIVLFVTWLLFGRDGVRIIFGGMRKKRDRLRSKALDWFREE